MKTKKKHDLRPTCSVCGGTNVEDTAWIAYREDGSCYVVNGEGPLDGDEASTWCHDCEEHHDLVYPDPCAGLESTAACYRRARALSNQRLKNDAARERGPELLAQLTAMVELIERDYAGFDAVEEWQAATKLITQITTGKEG